MPHQTPLMTFRLVRCLKRSWPVFLFAFCLMQQPGCRGGDAGKVPLVAHSTHGKELLSEFEAGFERDHPNVDVRWLDMGSQDVLDRGQQFHIHRKPAIELLWRPYRYSVRLAFSFHLPAFLRFFRSTPRPSKKCSLP